MKIMCLLPALLIRQAGPSQVIQRGVGALRTIVTDEDFHSIRHILSFYFPARVF
jgi:hypothetical protein